MIELPLIFAAGLLGSSHCIGMCGPFAILLGASTAETSGILRQIVYSAGRIFTYVTIGAVAGYGGLRLSDRAAGLVNVPALLSILAGCFLIYQGLATSGVLRFASRRGSGPCLAGGLLRSFLASPSQLNVFLAGMLTGMLPCGLVYGFVGIAASTRDLFSGALTMAAFGLGTVPIMIATGLSGGLLTLGTRKRLLQFAAWCVLLAGVVSIIRGLHFVGLSGTLQGQDCPLCP